MNGHPETRLPNTLNVNILASLGGADLLQKVPEVAAFGTASGMFVQVAALPNLTLVDTGVAGYRINPNFGRISAQRNSPRNMQLMLRYQF